VTMKLGTKDSVFQHQRAFYLHSSNHVLSGTLAPVISLGIGNAVPHITQFIWRAFSAHVS